MIRMKCRFRHASAGILAGLFALLLTRAVQADGPGFSIGGHTSPESYPGMTLAWREEFIGSSLDNRNWQHETGTGAEGWGNNERQYYQPENTEVRDGFLIITARHEDVGGRQYTSSRIVTRGRQAFRYGRIDIRAKLPGGQGIWPAFWMLGSSMDQVGWPAAGEIGIMELIGGQGRENTVHGTLHWRQDGGHLYEGGAITLPSGDFSDQFHVFSVVWNESSIRWLVDGHGYLEQDISGRAFDAFRQPFYLLVNLAVGGDWPGDPDDTTRFPQRLIVDYIRFFH